MKPIFSLNDNKITSGQGLESSFYELFAEDVEGVTPDTQDLMAKELERFLIDTEETMKLYCLNGRLFLNVFGEDLPPFYSVKESSNPLSIFAGDLDEVNFYDDYLIQNFEYIRIVSLEVPARFFGIHETLLWPDYVLNIRKIPREKAKSKVNLKRKLHVSSLFKDMRDIEGESAFNQAENLLEGITTESVGLYDVEIFFILRASTKDELDRETHAFIKEMSFKTAKVRIESRGLSYFYQGMIPGVYPSFKRSVQMPSDYLSYLFPIHRDHLFDEGMRLQARSGNNVCFDLFNETSINFNALITGTPGQGKSMIANKIIKHEVEHGSKALILDLGNSFLKTTKYLGGVNLSQAINPMQFKSARFLKEFIVAGIEEPMSKKDQGRLFEAIGNNLDKTDDFFDLLNLLNKDFDGIVYYFNEIECFIDNNIIEDNSLTYCDLSNYPDAIKAPLLVYLIEYFRSLNGKKIFVLDECWNLLEKNADFVAEAFRTFRKHHGSGIAISQNFDDFSKTQLGKVIIQCTNYKILFRQSLEPSEFISPFDIDLMEGIKSQKGEYSEFLFLSEGVKKPVRYIPTALEYQLFTSDPNDRIIYDEYMNEKGHFLPFRQAITNLTLMVNPLFDMGEQ